MEVIYSDNAPELKAAIEYLGYRHQTSIEYVDSTKSFVEREIRQMLEGCRTNLLQAGFPQQYWPLAMQHFAHAHNVLRSLGHEETPWERRFDQPFAGPLVPFGREGALLQQPTPTGPQHRQGLAQRHRKECSWDITFSPDTHGRASILSRSWRQLTTTLRTTVLSIQRVRSIQLEGGIVFPLKARQAEAEPKAIPKEQLVVPPEAELTYGELAKDDIVYYPTDARR